MKNEKKSLSNKFIDFDSIHSMKVDTNELAEHKIEKQAMLEAIFGTQLWSEPYIKNPFIYVTDHDSDF